MRIMFRWVLVALAAAVVLGCQVDRLLRGSGGGNGPPADSTAARVAFSTQPNSGTVGRAITPPVTVVVTDSAGNPVPSYSGSVTVALGANATGGTLSGANTVPAVNGVATFSGLSIDKAGTGYTLTASAAGLTGATSSAFQITAPPPPPPMATSLTFTTEPQSAQTGASLGAITVAAVDSTGTTVTDFSGTVVLAIGANPGGGTLSGSTTAALSNGVAAFSGLSIDQSGSGYTLTASTAGLKSAASSTFNVTAPVPTNQPPVVNAGGNESVVEGVLYHLNATFTDPDGAGDGPWTYSINWGDGTSSSGSLSAQGAIGPTHTYLLPNDYTITVTVTDAHGAAGTDSKTLHVTL